MNFAQLQTQLNQQITLLNRKINSFFNFVMGRLKNFKNLTLSEQISYGIIGAGLIFIIISIFLFIL
jgi:hypothetical protein